MSLIIKLFHPKKVKVYQKPETDKQPTLDWIMVEVYKRFSREPVKIMQLVPSWIAEDLYNQGVRDLNIVENIDLPFDRYNTLMVCLEKRIKRGYKE